MAKNEAPATRTARPKTPAQIAQRDLNIKNAQERLVRHQAKQALAKQLRELGYTGTDDEIITRFNYKKREEEESENRKNREDEAAAYVNNVLAVPNVGPKIGRWLKNRINQSPIYVKELITNFLNRDGSIDGQKDNSKLKAEVDLYMNTEQGQKILAHKRAA